jgi:subtilisin family serine protease
MGIDIAIIDSGVNPWHSHVQGVAGGVSFHVDESGEVAASDDYRDPLGHGTAIAGVIREKVPDGRLHAVRIFHESLEAPMSLLIAALEWAVEEQAKMIHLSLGTEREEFRPELERICRVASEKDMVIVAAARGPDDRVYPGAFETVIGVYWDRACVDDSLVYHPGRSVEFGACGRPLALPGMPEEDNFRGSSFAAARVTGLAADLLAKNPTQGAGWVKKALKNMAEKEKTHGNRE